MINSVGMGRGGRYPPAVYSREGPSGMPSTAGSVRCSSRDNIDSTVAALVASQDDANGPMGRDAAKNRLASAGPQAMTASSGSGKPDTPPILAPDAARGLGPPA